MHKQRAGPRTYYLLVGLVLVAQLVVLAFVPLRAWAAELAADPTSPVGTWRTIDDSTGKPKAVVRIFEQSGRLYGVVEKGLEANSAHSVCDNCTDDRRGKPIIGMDIIRGLARDGGQWDGGTILDPESGQVYKCRLTLQDGGRKLAVRGFVGISLLGRTQVWERLN
jgi:uncharacterized protein (DUF2147 family)